MECFGSFAVFSRSGSSVFLSGSHRSTIRITTAAPRHVQVRACLLEEAKKRFRRVKQVPLAAVPPPLRLEYVDIWELQQPMPCQQQAAAKPPRT
jgi:hypothetical protein